MSEEAKPLLDKAFPWHGTAFAQLLAQRERLPHGLLFNGPQGIGKFAFSKALAAALLCEAPRSEAGACGQCVACDWVAAGNHPDLRLVEPLTDQPEEGEGSRTEKRGGTPIKIEQVREVTDSLSISSHRSRARVVVIHPAEAMNLNAANALLKALEEPPPATYFLLVSHRPNQLLPTIKSRCRQMPLPAPDPAGAAKWLKEQGIADPVLALAQAGNAPLLAAAYTDADYWEPRSRLLRHLANRHASLYAAADDAGSMPIPRFVGWLQRWSYDLAAQRLVGRVRYNPDFQKALGQLAGSVDALAALRFHRDMVRLQRSVNHPLNPRLLIEDVLIRYFDLFAGRAA